LNIAFIGAGRLAQTVARAWARAGVSVSAVASRSRASSDALAAHVPGCMVCDSAQAAAEGADLVLITVPDDAIAATAAAIDWRAGQMVVHCSGATEVAVLQAAADAGALTGGFHPLQIFSDPEIAIEHLAGSTVAIEAAPPLFAVLEDLAARLGCPTITLPPGARARYHAAACYMASFVLSLPREAAQVWASFGVNEADTLQALFPMLLGTVDSARKKGLAGTLSGPISRGDVKVVERHLADLARLGPNQELFYKVLAQRQLPLAEERGIVSAQALARLRALLATAG